MNTLAEENYLKALYHLTMQTPEGAYTNYIAAYLQTKASSVTDMLKKLSSKKLVHYKKYQGVTLSKKGKQKALQVIRKHRLWEYFLVEKLNFRWDEVHEIAEQLEHIQSDELINRIDKLLGFPKYDPHGDPIPDANGYYEEIPFLTLFAIPVGEMVTICGVIDSSVSFLKLIENIGLTIGTLIKVEEIFEFDHSLKIAIPSRKTKVLVSQQISKNVLVKIKK
ncbi:Iron-dependent repressor IdeR [Flavobacteriales bacterium]|jgi:DtxR family Mn-dependent transcriptional regulator|nr:Transcriptional regulator MntR [Flavobacteriales bacterium]MCL4816948.1 metal-dependent transcriptional regulator [Flavobacteriales bacterium]WKZ76008.1 MAG: metal-dependent transcriptional regulator [Vicingaceae bacterium]GIK70449.1 MAG: iron-dependent repressor [Bacteroidota bacterium]CAG0980871.1 Iron-dependent repressor IdeR [Flavobacteriales bacterium]